MTYDTETRDLVHFQNIEHSYCKKAHIGLSSFTIGFLSVTKSVRKLDSVSFEIFLQKFNFSVCVFVS